MKILAITLLIIIVLSQTGCWDQKIYEQIGFILQIGLELDEKGQMLYTTSIPIIEPGMKGSVNIISTSANLLREGREKIRLVSGKEVEGGKVQHIFFSKHLAKKGILPLLEVFIRNPENPLLANVIVVDGSPNEMMKFSTSFKDKPKPIFYVNDLLVDARQNAYIPETRISHFTVLAYSKTIDPITPFIRYNKKEMQIVGSALFSGDKMVGEINTAQTSMLLTLTGKKSAMTYIYKINPTETGKQEIKSGVAISIKKVKKKIKTYIEEDFPVIDIKLDLKASIDEYDGPHNLSNLEDLEKLEKEIAQSIKEDYVELLKYLQEVGSDPVGFGELFRTKHNEYWKVIKWKDIYKEATFNIDVTLNFEFYGAMD